MSRNDLDAWFNKVDKAFTKSFRQTRVNVEHSANRDMQSVVTMLFATLNKILKSENQSITPQTNAAILKEQLEQVVNKHYFEESELQGDAERFKRQLEEIRNRVDTLVQNIKDNLEPEQEREVEGGMIGEDE